MTRYAALLRAINLAGKNKVAMADLRALAERLGLGGVSTLLQSGNLVFETAKGTAPALESRLEAETATRLGVATEYFVRTAAEWAHVIARNPFPDAARRDPGHLIVLFLKAAPAAAAVERLRAAIVGRETVAAAGRELYAVYPDGAGRSKLTVALIEKHLGTRGTGRNWNTVLKVGACLTS